MPSMKQTIAEHLAEFRWRLLAVLIWVWFDLSCSPAFCSGYLQMVDRFFEQKLIVLGPDDILKYISLASLVAFSLTLPLWSIRFGNLSDLL